MLRTGRFSIKTNQAVDTVRGVNQEETMFTSITGHDNLAYARREARRNFSDLVQQGWRRQLWSKVTGRPKTLLNLHEVHATQQVRSRSHAGVRMAPIARIQGSEGRCADFDADFRPLKELSEARWISIACARQADVPLPLVELIQVDDIYFVRDGHHRISVARWLGQQEIEAEVTVWHCRAIAADLPSQTSALPAIKTTQLPARGLASLMTKVGERLLALLQKMQPLPQHILTQGS
jgi:hypothetical protein